MSEKKSVRFATQTETEHESERESELHTLHSRRRSERMPSREIYKLVLPNVFAAAGGQDQESRAVEVKLSGEIIKLRIVQRGLNFFLDVEGNQVIAEAYWIQFRGKSLFTLFLS